MPPLFTSVPEAVSVAPESRSMFRAPEAIVLPPVIVQTAFASTVIVPKLTNPVPRPEIVPALAADASSSTVLNAPSATTAPSNDAPGSRISLDAPAPK